MKNSNTLENPKILLIGAGGQLGKELADLFSKNAIAVITLSKSELDIRDIARIREILKISNFQYIINCAAYTNVDRAELEKESCLDINATSVKNLANACKDFAIELIHISTDFVFSSENFREFEISDSYCPANYYGLSKSAGESYILDIIPDSSYIIRTSWLYGRYGGNFMNAITAKIMNKDYFNVVDDQFGQPTNALYLANFVYSITSGILNPGVFHFASKGFTSRLNWAREIENFYYNGPTRISATKMENVTSEAKRPVYSILSLSSLNDAKVQVPGCWDEVLLNYLNTIGFRIKVN